MPSPTADTSGAHNKPHSLESSLQQSLQLASAPESTPATAESSAAHPLGPPPPAASQQAVELDPIPAGGRQEEKGKATSKGPESRPGAGEIVVREEEQDAQVAWRTDVEMLSGTLIREVRTYRIRAIILCAVNHTYWLSCLIIRVWNSKDGAPW